MSLGNFERQTNFSLVSILKSANEGVPVPSEIPKSLHRSWHTKGKGLCLKDAWHAMVQSYKSSKRKDMVQSPCKLLLS